jgi:isocitrate dehydrogenase
LFRKVFDEISRDYPQIKTDHMIIDIGAARLATRPEDFEVIVLPNLYGDILSDIAAQMTGSVGLAGSANIGARFAMFEAIHGSAPDIAGKGIANPSGLLLSAIMMLQHVGQAKVATQLHNAWLATIEQGIHTRDLFRQGKSQRLASTSEFSSAIIENLGALPQNLPAVSESSHGVAGQNPIASGTSPASLPTSSTTELYPVSYHSETKQLDGIDVFLHWHNARHDRQIVEGIAAAMQQVAGIQFDVRMITNRGVKVWPQGFDETFCTDHWRVRFMFQANAPRSHQAIAELLQRLADRNIDFIKTEHLYRFNNVPRYSLGQGE